MQHPDGKQQQRPVCPVPDKVRTQMAYRDACVSPGRRELLQASLVCGGVASSPVWAQSRATREIRVENVSQLHRALDEANRTGGGCTLMLEDGVYAVERTLQVLAPAITVVSASRQRHAVVLRGDAMSAQARIGNVLRVSAPDFALRSVTVERCRYYAVQIAGESGAHRPQLLDCVFRDAFEQLVKVSGAWPRQSAPCEGGLIEQCLFEYTAGIGPQYYIGGIDGHQCSGWIVRRNVFRHIASPGHHIAEHAIHFWGLQDIIAEANLIIDCDRGIGFGMGRERSVRGGVIRNNVIHHRANGNPFADVGIILESSPGIDVLHNTVFQEHGYPRAIEYRFPGTQGGRIINNLTNRAIASRDGGSAITSHNHERAQSSLFRDVSASDFRLRAPASGVGEAGMALPQADSDFDGHPRRPGRFPTIGAFELHP